jgi:hypothetical protein
MEGISVFLRMEGREGIEIDSCPPPQSKTIDALLLSQRQGSKRARNLIVSRHPRTPR